MRFPLLFVLLAAGCASPYATAKTEYVGCLREHLNTPDACEGYRRIWEVESRARQIELAVEEGPGATVPRAQP